MIPSQKRAKYLHIFWFSKRNDHLEFCLSIQNPKSGFKFYFLVKSIQPKTKKAHQLQFLAIDGLVIVLNP